MPTTGSTSNPLSEPRPAAAKERHWVLLLCGLAAAHVFVFSAAFPFFNVVDEAVHFDLVVRYSHAGVPRAFTHLSAEAVPFLTVFHTVEYYHSPDEFPGHQIPAPPWTLPPEVARKGMAERADQWSHGVINYECSQPPLYYAVAGWWWRCGKLLRLDGGALLYWLRFLNLLVMAAVVWLAYVAARMLFPENRFIRLAAPALVAFMPQTAFYSITNDVFSPLAFGAAFVLLLKLWASECTDRRLAAATGLALAAAFLAKICNLPLLAVAGVALALKTVQLARCGKLRPAAPALGMLVACAALPMAAWMAWCKIHFGDLTGSAQKVQIVGWTNKPFLAWFHHPIFTPHGFWIFVSQNLATLWQGEFLWHNQPLPRPGVGLVYAGLTLLFLLAALVALIRQPGRFSRLPWIVLWFNFACLAAFFLFAALLSVKYDFDDCLYPSRAHPFFTSGRLMLGALVPFLLLFAFGMDCLLKRLGEAAKFLLLTALLIFMLASEIATDWLIFPNAYNWFHLQ
ncbi:MAG: DUF2142 domain-containing protein [Verrucomicrobiota bacterium]